MKYKVSIDSRHTFVKNGIELDSIIVDLLASGVLSHQITITVIPLDFF